MFFSIGGGKPFSLCLFPSKTSPLSKKDGLALGRIEEEEDEKKERQKDRKKARKEGRKQGRKKQPKRGTTFFRIVACNLSKVRPASIVFATGGARSPLFEASCPRETLHSTRWNAFKTRLFLGKTKGH